MFGMIIFVVTINKNIFKIDNNKLPNIRMKNMIHYSHEGTWSN